MKVLITGGFGYLGGRLAESLARETGYEIVLGSRSHAEPAPSWLPGASITRTDWHSPRGLKRICAGLDAIVHAAGMNAQDCAADPVAALQVNSVATARLLQGAIRQGVRRFVYISTAHVYGSPLTGVITEANCPVSLHPYAASHRAGEDAVRAAHEHGAIEGVVIRLSNAFGPPAHEDANCWMLLVNDVCRQAVESARMVLQSSGAQRRDFMPLVDACAAIRHLLELPASVLGDGLFNVGGGWSPTVLEMTERVASRMHAATGRRPEILRGPDQGNSKPSVFDYKIDKLTATGFDPRGHQHVDCEIDGLIRFCLARFAPHS